MSYTKTTWQDQDVITAAKLNNAEVGIETLDKASAEYAKSKEVASTYAKKGTQISSPDATDSDSAETVNPAEFTKMKTLVNEMKAALNKMNGFAE